MSRKEASGKVADLVVETVKACPGAMIALPAGRTPEELYRELVHRFRAGEVSFSETRFLLLTEFETAGPEDPVSCRKSVEDRFLARVDARPDRILVPSGENIQKLDQLIDDAGGIALAILGIGQNGHFAYNEPTTQFSSPSHRQKLSPGTRRKLLEIYGGELNVPEYAWTVGIRSIVSAGTIVVMAFGEEKAGPVFKMLYARDDSLVPAAYLQIPRDVRVYLDAAAASQISEKEGNT